VTFPRTELSRILLTGMTGLMSIFPLSCCLADARGPSSSPPRPSADYAVRGKTDPDGGDLHLSYSSGRMRLEVSMPALASVLTCLVDFGSRRTVILSELPGMDVLGFEIEMPPEYSFADMPAGSVRAGSSEVGSEPCEIWRSPASSQVPVEVCLTADGIPLKAKVVTLRGERVGFEATELDRGVQDPASFEVPEGVKVRRVPRGMESMIPGLKR
jgi:hypothetical protein